MTVPSGATGDVDRTRERQAIIAIVVRSALEGMKDVCDRLHTVTLKLDCDPAPKQSHHEYVVTLSSLLSDFRLRYAQDYFRTAEAPREWHALGAIARLAQSTLESQLALLESLKPESAEDECEAAYKRAAAELLPKAKLLRSALLDL